VLDFATERGLGAFRPFTAGLLGFGRPVPMVPAPCRRIEV